MRKAKIIRKTKETSISVAVNLDGKGKYKIKTGIGFLDHMLEQLSKHSLIDLEVKAKGDMHIDLHHTTEDTGIAIGEAIKKAAGNRKGITRYASTMIPMDETLSRVSIDVSNRPYLIWKVDLAVEKLGEMDTELFKEWFQAFSQSAGVTLHVENIYGDNSHHKIESCYKGLARSLKDALAIEEDIDLNMHLIRNVPATFIIRVQGKSMVDVGINDGDLLVVDKSLKPKNFSTVIANVHDELVVKTLVQERDKKFLTSGSKEFSNRILINEEEDVFIWGVVTYVIHSTY